MYFKALRLARILSRNGNVAAAQLVLLAVFKGPICYANGMERV